MERPLALVIDGDPAVRSLVRSFFEEMGVLTLGASSSPEAMDILRTRPIGIMVVELRAPGVSAADLLGASSRLRPEAAIALLADESNAEEALSALELGACEIELKPLSELRLRTLAERLIRQNNLLSERARLRSELRGRAGYGRIVGRSETMEHLRERLERLAATDSNVLFIGEAGTGKELAARTLHSFSRWKDTPFVPVDCASMPPESLSTELFGEKAGDGAGLLGRNHGAVVFLRSVGWLPEQLQDRLLEALRLRSAPRAAELSPPVLSGSDVDLLEAAERGRVREELARNLSSMAVHLPPLRERVGDIPVLAHHFIEMIRDINELPPIDLAPDTVSVLERYSWPGNVRELRNAIEHSVILNSGGIVRPQDLPDSIRDAREVAETLPTRYKRVFKEAKREVVERFERGYLEDLLDRHRGNVTAAAQQAGMLRSALQRLLRKHGLRSASFRRRDL